MPARPLRPVDPRARRGRAYRAYARLTGTRLAGQLSKHVGWRLDPLLLRLTGGRLGVGLMIPTAVLETTGARTGARRRNVVIYFHDGDRVVLNAARLGEPRHPGWFHNAVADPDVTLGGHPFRAAVVEDAAERARLWELADLVFPAYADFRARAAATGRTIPLLVLTPRPEP